MEYVFLGILLLIVLMLRSRVVIKKKARDFVFDVALPSIIVKEFPDKEIGFIGAYIFAKQREIFDDIAVNHILGAYGARMALARLNLVPAILNSDDALQLFEGVTGDELLAMVKQIILEIEKQLNPKT